MAIIHQGKNGLKEKLENYYEEAFQEAKKLFYWQIEDDKKTYEQAKVAYRRSAPLNLLLLLLAVALILLLVMRPEIIQGIQEAVYGWLVGLEEALGDGMRSQMSSGSPEGLGAILLNLVLSFLQLIAAVLLWLFRVSSGVLVFLICFAIPVCIGFCAIVGFKPPQKPVLDRVFHEEATRERVRNGSLPSEMRILQAGLEGEEAALDMLSKLGDDCHVYTNLLIPYEGKVSETDVIVVAPHAVTIVEVKNYKDTLVGDWSDEHLVIETERGQTVHEKEVYNPVKQVATHVYRLGNYLREHGAEVVVNRCVLFVHSDIKLFYMNDEKNVLAECPVFEAYQTSTLFDYLQGGSKEASSRRVVQLLNELLAQQANA